MIALILFFATAFNYSTPATGHLFFQSSADRVTLTGRVSCAKCEGIQPMHKGYTNLTWALYSVSQGDEIVFVANNATYKLNGDHDQLLKYIANKATVSGRLEGTTLTVESIGRPTKRK
jgi:hypothetical protein